MNKRNFSIFTLFLAVFGLFINTSVFAGSHGEEGGHGEGEPFNAVETIMHHIKDAHEWHLWGGHHGTSIYLPIILIDEYQDKTFQNIAENDLDFFEKTYLEMSGN